MIEGKLKYAVRPATLLVMTAAVALGLGLIGLNLSREQRPSVKRVLHASQFSYLGRGVPGGTFMNNSYASGSDYLADIVAEGGGMHRWPRAKFPLKVFIADGSRVPGYLPQMRQMIAQAFNDWQTSTNGVVSWRQVTNPMQADIVALWTADVQARGGGVEAGNTESLTSVDPYTRSGQIEAAKITILTGMNGRPFSDTEMRKTTLHEVGHSLGLEGHSRTQTDIMYPAVNPAQTPYLKQRDVNTLVRLYSGNPATNGGFSGFGGAPLAMAPYGGPRSMAPYGGPGSMAPYGGPGSMAPYGGPAVASIPGSVLGQLARNWIQQRLGY